MPHVPTVDIRRLGDIRFDTQLERALRPSPDYDVSQWLFSAQPIHGVPVYPGHPGDRSP